MPSASELAPADLDGPCSRVSINDVRVHGP